MGWVIVVCRERPTLLRSKKSMPVLLPENKYSQRLNAVLNFAHGNLHNDLKLDSLADVACWSKYHFTRVFRDQVGESPISFINRIRLEKAACLLSHARELSVFNVATRCGYSSSPFFSRSFGDRFGHCPRDFKDIHRYSLEYDKGNNNVDLMLEQTHTMGIAYDQQYSARQVKIIRSPPIRVAYVRNIGQYGANSGIREAMQSVAKWAKTRRLWTESTRIIGVSWDFSSITPKTLCRYDACIPIPDHYSDTSDISVQTLPGGIYATMRVSIKTAQEIFLLWKLLYLTLDTSPKFNQYQFENNTGPWYEIFEPEFVDGKFDVTLCVYRS